MTANQEIDVNGATQIDIADVMPCPIDTLKEAVRELERDYKAVTRYQLAANDMRATIADLRNTVTDATNAGDDERAFEAMKALRAESLRMSKALERADDAEFNIENKRKAVATALEAL